MMADEIIEEVWRIKDDLAREHGYDLDRLGAYFRERERQRAQREKERAAAGDGTAGDGRLSEGGDAVMWVDAEFGPRRGGGGDRSGS